tara:strand:- start:2138 stop:2296 length:159 start_codon:yes stop_codon:yes gene_type:complete
MKKYTVSVTATYEGEVIANSKSEARKLYLEEISLSRVLGIAAVDVHKWRKDE